MAIARFGFGVERLGVEPMAAIKLKGTSAADSFDISGGGDYHLRGRGGDDTVIAGAEFTAKDRFYGGDGHDVLDLSGGGYLQGLTFGAHSLTSVEEIRLGNFNTYTLTLDAANAPAGSTLLIDGTNAQATVIDGTAVEGDLVIKGGYVRGLLNGGAGDDVLYAGGDGTVMYGHGGTTGSSSATNPTAMSWLRSRPRISRTATSST